MSNELCLWLAAAGGCAIIAEMPRLGWLLLAPALIKWLLAPTLYPLVFAYAASLGPADVSTFILMSLLALPVVLGIAALWVLQQSTDSVFGKRVADSVTIHYLIILIDGCIRACKQALWAPVHFIRWMIRN